MGFVERAGIETSLPDMAGGGMTCVPIGGVASVSVLKSSRQRFGGAGEGDQVNVIGHQAVAEKGKTAELGILA